MADPVTVSVPKRRFFVGSFAFLRIEIDPASGIAFDDLAFSVPDGRRAGAISPSRDARFDPMSPTITLLIGHEPSDWFILATQISTGQDLAKFDFHTTNRWRGKKRGPRLWFDGQNFRQEAASAWGGGQAGPQNVNIVPAAGTRRIAILFVETASQAFPTGATFDTIRDRWIDELINGVTVGGVTRSAQAYFREVSYGNFDLSAQTFGPVALTGPWTDYFNDDGSFKGTYPQN